MNRLQKEAIVEADTRGWVRPPSKPANEGESPLPLDDYIKRASVQRQDRVLVYLFWLYGFVVFATFVIIFLQGFRVLGFQLDASFLHWLGAATLTEAGTVVGLVFPAVFGIDLRRRGKPTR